jgi:hypothetical protein
MVAVAHNRCCIGSPDSRSSEQYRLSVVPIELGDGDAWLNSTLDQAQAPIAFAPAEVFDAGPLGA